MTAQKKDIMRNVAYWSIFIFAASTLTLKILEVSADNSIGFINQNPEIAQYSALAQTGYLFER